MDTNTDIPQPCYWYTRGYLPHYDDQLRTQFVTFRLADSLPKTVLDKFKAALDRNLITEIEYHRRLDRFLDTGYGSNFLKDPKIADTVAENLYRFHDDKYRLLSWVIMPNHVHILIAQLNETPLAEIMHSMKSFTSHTANKLLGRTGRFWSKEYFDRYIRDENHFAKTVAYIENNPVKAKLCQTPPDWPWGSARFTK